MIRCEVRESDEYGRYPVVILNNRYDQEGVKDYKYMYFNSEGDAYHFVSMMNYAYDQGLIDGLSRVLNNEIYHIRNKQ